MSARALPHRPPPVLLLDAGNTVVFFDEDAAAEVLAREGVRLIPEILRASHGAAKRAYESFLKGGGTHDAGWMRYVAALLRTAGAPEPRIQPLVHALRAEHDRTNLWRRVPVDVPSALERLRGGGVRLGIVSNSEGSIAELLEQVGLLPFFEVIIDSGCEGVSKPDPEIFRRALSRMNVSASEAMYVGDVPAVDVDGARAAGLGAVLVDAYDQYPDYREAPRIRSVAELATAWLP